VRADELLDTTAELSGIHDAIVPSHELRLGLVVSVAIVAFAGSAASGAAVPTRASTCADVVRFRATLYEGTFVGHTMRRAAQRVHAVRPGCNETPGVHEADTAATLANIEGISTAIALLATDNTRHVYLVSGVFPENPNHPLHIALYGNRARPNDCLGAKVLGSLRIRGTVSETPFAFNQLSVRMTAGTTSLLWVDALTRLGYPFTRPLVKGRGVIIAALRCRRPNTTASILVARRIDLR
jgi:hypothetical protein